MARVQYEDGSMYVIATAALYRVRFYSGLEYDWSVPLQCPAFSPFYTLANKVCGGFTGISLSVGRAVGLSAKSCLDNSSYSFSPIHLILGRSVHEL